MEDKIKTYGSARGETHVYAVEARVTRGGPAQVAGNLVTETWRQMYFAKSPDGRGVPSLWHHPVSDRFLTGLHSYQAALALAHWFLSMPDESRILHDIKMHCFCVEVRLVKVSLKYSYSTEEEGVGDAISAEERDEKFTTRVP